MALVGKRIVVVDDDFELRELVGDLLSRDDFVVFRAENVEIAREILAKEQLDLMVLDLMLPDQDGPMGASC
ncbi:response regulator [Thioclava sp. F36-7]|uniref:response regulator n=1 Tax=Thioclava sp. F36-7 TaxID=1915317 RepID=UPI00099885AF|nr:response regulator [Thioclava sp. F36-7]OOY07015.1 hypothetical protein BMI89_19755 [Thioclava sp. F36-7]